ncbi:hypothetical protein J8M21_04960 [Pseudoalteromonas luteoviolacea]|uniref:DUF6445 family protein n=1 Tax=Pseudoalteromonas luteoviolacea TaxID=43657 RepID=UPI001B3A67BE|nr:DUF6445 family protein [Pseudoalteromonas luteoviolacea]MBQ4876559.1 hypothetical protein [Pseudoalteromonas luteoviolacea]MBQ4905190.1 hypothetical protein [Pseudoalteromonas luteoviolacea]
MKAEVEYIGDSRQPVVIIDEFLNDYDDVLTQGYGDGFAQERGETNFYPGNRKLVSQPLLDSVCDKLKPIIAETFGLNVNYPEWQEGYFAYVNKPAEALLPLQKVPHFDSVCKRQIAAILYLCEPDLGGTGFYKHVETGLELVEEGEVKRYQQSVLKQLEQYQFDGYCVGSNECFTQIHKVDAKPNRLVLYRSALLHSGIITEKNFDKAYGKKRLTMTVFMYF